MGRSEADRYEAQRLQLAARKDWQALNGMHDATVFADEVFGFHAQQAVEKTLKAWLSFSGVEYPRTHDISLLLSTLNMRGENVDSYYDLLEFNPYAVQFRYEAFDEIGTPLERAKVIKRVGTLLNHVERLLNE